MVCWIGAPGNGAGPRYGEPVLVKPRLGQGAFRVSVMDAYRRECALSGGRVLPALEAAHIRPYAAGGAHAVANGILLRRDIHSVFDAGYLTFDAALRCVVSDRVKSDFNNGNEYRRLHGAQLADTARPDWAPDAAAGQPLISSLGRNMSSARRPAPCGGQRSATLLDAATGAPVTKSRSSLSGSGGCLRGVRGLPAHVAHDTARPCESVCDPADRLGLTGQVKPAGGSARRVPRAVCRGSKQAHQNAN